MAQHGVEIPLPEVGKWQCLTADKVTASAAYTSNQDSRALDKRDVSSPVVSRSFCLLCVV